MMELGSYRDRGLWLLLILVVSCFIFMWIGALDSSDLLLSYSVTTLASPITIILKPLYWYLLLNIKHINISSPCTLRRIMKPFLLRRLKRDVITELPKKIEHTILCPQSMLQIAVYEIIKKSVQKIEQDKRCVGRKSSLHSDAYVIQGDWDVNLELWLLLYILYLVVH